MRDQERDESLSAAEKATISEESAVSCGSLNSSAAAYSFGPFHFRPSDGLLCHQGQEKPLPPKTADVLEMLLRNPGHVVSKEDLLETVWEGAFVTESSLTDAVSALRHELGDDPHEPTYIQTIHRRGYRFIAKVKVERAGDEARGSTTVGASTRKKSGIAWGMAGLVTAVTVIAVALLVSSAIQTARLGTGQTRRFHVDLPPGANVQNWDRHAVALSPDGSNLIYSAGTRLYLQPLGDLEASEVRETSPEFGTSFGGRSPFFSPDGQQFGYNQDDGLKRRVLSGGAPVDLCVSLHSFGASWSPVGDSIVYGQGPEGIWRIPSDGGEPEQLVQLEPGQSAHGPEILPGGEWLLFTLKPGSGRWDDAQIVAQSLETGERTPLISGGSDARYVPTGHLVYARQQVLYAVPFDPEDRVVGSDPVAVIEGVRRSEGDVTGAAHFSFSQTGDLAYLTPSRLATRYSWVDRQGFPTPLAEKEGAAHLPRLSPEGLRLAASFRDETGEHIWIYEFDRGHWQRLTAEGKNRTPVWSPDGLWIVFSSDRLREGHWNLYRRRADFSGSAELLLEKEYRQFARDLSPDDKLLLFSDSGPPYDPDVSILHLEEGEVTPWVEPLLQTPVQREVPHGFSPDGRWILYGSEESGRNEAYVQAYPGPGGPWQISDGGAGNARWSSNGREILYWSDERMSDRRMMVVEVQTEPAFVPGSPRVLFEAEAPIAVGNSFDVTADGQRFLMYRVEHEGAQPQINIVLDWFEELKQKVPAGRWWWPF